MKDYGNPRWIDDMAKIIPAAVGEDGVARTTDSRIQASEPIPDQSGQPHEDCGHPPCEPHPCPYREEIQHDSETLCTCCEKCQEACGREI